MDSQGNLAKELAFSFNNVRKAFFIAAPHPQKTGLRQSEMFMLMNMARCLRQGDVPLTVSALSRMTGQTLPAVSQTVNRLEDLGYVTKAPSPKDKRVLDLTLTPKGQAMIHHDHQPFFELMEEIVKAMGPEKCQTLIELHSELSQVVKEIKQTRKESHD